MLALVDDPRPTVRADVARALGSLGGDEAAAGLSTLLDDPEPAVRAAAATGLGRLGHWPAATAIGQRLRDPSWDVRRAAGNALTRLGAPGALLLRHYAADADPFAADMARRVVRNAELRDTSRARP
jgi:HEAT repeat protein